MADGADRYFNRELSWLQFNSRVLAQAEDQSLPLLERVKFCAIHSQNLDEFFQVRVAGLKEKIEASKAAPSVDGRTPAQQLHEISIEVEAQHNRKQAVLENELLPHLAAEGLGLTDTRSLGPDDAKFLEGEFEHRLFPILTPLAVDPGHPFPYISNLSLNLGVRLRDPRTGVARFARLKVPTTFGRFVFLPDGERFVALEHLIAEHLDKLFPGMDILEFGVFRVTRNADLAIDEREADDLMSAVELELQRRRFRNVVRVEVEHPISAELRDLLIDEFEIDRTDLYINSGPLGLDGLWQLHDVDRPDLKDPSWSSVVPNEVSGDGEPVDFFSVLRDRDILVHHPYMSFDATVQEFIRQASTDRRVRAIKLTLYRTSGDSPIVDSLIRAAESGIQVAVVVELKARFDEEANIAWARSLERAGVHVAYGLMGLKVHTKTCLVVRDEPDGLRRYCHVGTGNYNSKTAHIYEDLGILTSDYDVGSDLTQLFNTLTGYGHAIDYRTLVVAPSDMRSRIEAAIATEAALGSDGRIIMKMNSLVDPQMIEALYEASQAGVSIDLVVRGICCLRPGVAGMSENIRVRSIVGRYLEHSRIYNFAHGAGSTSPLYLIGSADLMPRNLDRRIEALIAVEEPRLQDELENVLQVNLADDVLAWELDGDGIWTRLTGGTSNTHDQLEELATTVMGDG
jgi:polyphosphate kinase